MQVPEPFVPPARALLGPGPSEVAPAVLRALGAPTIGHLDPALTAALRETSAMLRETFETKEEWTLAVSGTGTAAMEAALVNLIEPGERVLVAVHGYFGERIVEIASRCGAEVVRVDGEWGRPSDPARLRSAAGGRRVALVAAVHAETSTGVRQELAPLRELADELGALLAIDAVTSLGCIPIEAEAHRLDAVWSCSQKGLSCTPGLSPLTLSRRAADRVRARSRKVQSFYLDLPQLAQYWTTGAPYHHTISSNLVAGLHAALRLVIEEGLPARFARHGLHARALAAGLGALGLELLVPEAERLPQLTAVRIPPGVDDARVRNRLLAEHQVEIGGGLGALKGKIWRIGLMGHGATRANACLCLEKLRDVLAAEGWRPRGDALAAAESVLAANASRERADARARA